MVRALRRLLPFVLSARVALLAGFAAILAATVVSLASPLVLKYVVDGLTEGVDRTRLALYALALPALAATDGAFRYLMRRRLIGASRTIEYDLRNAFFSHLQRLPLADVQAGRTGDLMSRAVNDLSAVRMMVGPAVMYLGSTALTFVFAIAVMTWMDARLTLLALAPLPGVTLATHYFGRAIHHRFEQIQARLSDLSAVAQEALAGVRVVRAFGQEPAEIARFRSANDDYVAGNRRLITLQSAFYPSLTLCFGLSGVAVLWFGGRDVMTGRLTLGEFVAFSRYLVLLAWPLIAFGWVINIVQRGTASWLRMLEVMDTPPARDDGTSLDRPVRGDLEVRGLTFRYPGTEVDALTDVSFRVGPGRTLAIVGPTGSGKSTVVQLLTRLHDPPPGTVFLDGRDVRTLPLADLRRAFGVAPQEAFLFSDTVGTNLAFGLEADPADPGVERALTASADAAGLGPDLAGFSRGLETVVGERGITLSGGQKQRVALARALAVQPRVLVLDDALSAVDTSTEDAILGRLREVRRTRTCLIVAHRVSTVRDADEIIVLDAGRVVERGTHATLVAAGGLYAEMHRRQLLEREIASA